MSETNTLSAAERTAHSPGPFALGGEYDNKRDEILDADGRTIAGVWTREAYPGATARPQFKDVPKGKANARLFAAAPEFLAKSQHIARMRMYGDGPDELAPDGDDAMRVLNWLIVDARAAIAKAEGEQ